MWDAHDTRKYIKCSKCIRHFLHYLSYKTTSSTEILSLFFIIIIIIFENANSDKNPQYNCIPTNVFLHPLISIIFELRASLKKRIVDFQFPSANRDNGVSQRPQWPPFCCRRFEFRFLALPKALIPWWLNLTVGKDVSHGRFLEEEPVARSKPKAPRGRGRVRTFGPSRLSFPSRRTSVANL